jgi:beta-lactamase superfamily II metal-dependent hydrolase
MTALPSLAILDVGHGTCIVLTDTNGVTIFDAARGGILLDYLKHRGVHEISTILISHADDDHVAGLMSLLLSNSVLVRKVYLNSDAKRQTSTWEDLRAAVAYARKKRKATVTNTQLNTSINDSLDHGVVSIQVLSPTPELTMAGIGGRDLNGKRLSTHAMSAVVRLTKGSVPLVLIPGDIDYSGMDSLLQECADIKAPVLVFPHHGGHPAGDVDRFVHRLCSAVKPDCIVFSTGRTRYGTPRPDVVHSIRESLPKVRIVCTQLSEHCAVDTPATEPQHLNDVPAAGRCARACCAGTIIVDLSRKKPLVTPDKGRHTAFIDRVTKNALCR